MVTEDEETVKSETVLLEVTMLVTVVKSCETCALENQGGMMELKEEKHLVHFLLVTLQ